MTQLSSRIQGQVVYIYIYISTGNAKKHVTLSLMTMCRKKSSHLFLYVNKPNSFDAHHI